VQRLADQSLPTGISPGRYHLHDLIRARARTLGAAHGPEPERTTALDRLLDYYAHTAQRASIPIAHPPRPAPDGPTPTYAPDLHSPEAARTWLRAEYPNLEVAFTRADTRAADRHTIALAAGLAELLCAEGPWSRVIEIHQVAAEAARRQNELTAHAAALNNLGRVRCLAGGLPGAAEDLTQALEIHWQMGNRPKEAWVLNHYAASTAATGDRSRAFALYRQALAMNRELNKPDDEPISLEGIAEHHLADGDTPGTTTYLRLALDIYQRLGMREDAKRVQARLDRLGTAESQS
jgi:tetratricopeptide (TPR) repeat protein